MRSAYERAWSDVSDPDEDAYAAGVAWGSAAAYGDLAAASPPGYDVPPPVAAAPPDEEDDDDDFDWSDHGKRAEGRRCRKNK